MADFLTILIAAFVAQLAVLPGEKVQFIIAGLSTKYHPLGVVAAAGSAFAGWTVLEIWFGNALQQTLSPIVLDGISAGLFLLFAVLLVRSAPERGAEQSVATDGGVGAVDDVQIPFTNRTVPDAFGGYLPIFVLMATGEFGDKTQIVTIGLAAQYGASPAIWAGEMLAIIPVSLLNAYFFSRFTHLFDLRNTHFFAGGLFAFFGLDTLLAMVTGFSFWETAVELVSQALLALI
jgi:putative Ca2+/H+ antiporter (TMEM165/GDT1 family)